MFHHSCLSYRAFLVALAAAAVIGCSASASNPVSPSPGSGSTTLTADQLAGTWTLSSLQPAGQPEQAAPAGAVYNLTFADARLSARTDCNVCSGAFTVSDETLVAGPALACTRAACPTMAFENQYTGLLSGESTAVVSDAALTLSSARGTLRLTR
jgi:heat shock protein HslJ